MIQDIDFANMLYYNYQDYKEPSLNKKRIKHSEILPLIQRLKDSDIFTVKEVGTSVEHRPIFLISFGTGNSKIFLWSQMHGDESTATTALFDIINFISADDNLNRFRSDLLKDTTIYLMPMVNPDGAESFQRRNAFGIDINRDAIRKQTPEAKILSETFNSIHADFGFNLHDQDRLYSAGHTFKSAAVSFLAPPIDHSKQVNSVRINAIKLISRLYKVISDFIPGHIAKYKDDFEPRAFGDNFQKSGTSTVLIESGGWKDDPEKQFIRKINFIVLLTSFKCIAEKSYENENMESYDIIPYNEKDIFDLILRDLTVQSSNSKYTIDLGIIRNEVTVNNAKGYYYKSILEDKGDLSISFGYEDHDFPGMEIKPGKTYGNIFSSITEVEKLDFTKLYKNGYTNVLLKSDNFVSKYTTLPINIILNKELMENNDIYIGNNPGFIIVKDGMIRYVVINGFLYDTMDDIGKIENGIVY